MKRLAVPLFALLALATLAVALPAQNVAPEKLTFTCDPIDYPDGTTGMAVVTVDLSSNVAAPTVLVSVDYYTDGGAEHIGRFEDWSNTGTYPRDRYEAERVAIVHYYDKW